MAQPYRKNAVYGSLAYDLDALVRERQLEEAGKLPSKQQPAVQEKPLPRRRPQARAAARPSPLVAGGVVVLLAMGVVLMPSPMCPAACPPSNARSPIWTSSTSRC